MTFFAKDNRAASPLPWRGTVHSRLRLIALLLTAAAAALLLAGCFPPGGGDTAPTGGSGGSTADKPGGEGGETKPPGGEGAKPPGTTTPPPGGGEVSKPVVFTTTVTGSIQDKAFGTGLSGVKVSALITPVNTLVNSENKPAVSASDGKFTLQVKHSGTFKLFMESTCYTPFTTTDISASADASYDAGAIGLTAKPEPTGAARYTFTSKGTAANKKFKLTVNCVREISNNEFNAIIAAGIIRAKASAEGLNNTQAQSMITEISLPPTLTKVGNSAFYSHLSMSGTLTIPRNVETIDGMAFHSLGKNSSTVPIIEFESGSRLKTIGDSAFRDSRLQDFTLPENLETIAQSAFLRTRFDFSSGVPKTLIIPAKVSKIGDLAFGSPITRFTSGITAVEIRSNALAKPSPSAPPPFPLGNLPFLNIRGIAEIRLPQAVYNSYTATERTAIFGTITLKPQ